MFVRNQCDSPLVVDQRLPSSTYFRRVLHRSVDRPQERKEEAIRITSFQEDEW